MDNYDGSLKLFDLNSLMNVYSPPDIVNLSHQDANLAQMQFRPGAQIDFQDLLKMDSGAQQSNSSAIDLLTPIVTQTIRVLGDWPFESSPVSVPSYSADHKVKAYPEPQVPLNTVHVQVIREPQVNEQPFGFQADIEPGKTIKAAPFRASFNSNYLLIQLIRIVIFSN